ncbi:MAG: sugar phosphate isomerase/epimerase [Acidobacteriaceae bacterium]|nr:sugar phosphate isomerase/epimerase [Acidobacteriaceae bacterium]
MSSTVPAIAAELRQSRGEPAQAPGFQLGCVTYNLLQNMELETIIETLESTGIAALELRTGQKHGVEPSLGPQERARVRQRFERSKVRLLSYGTTCEFQSPDPEVRRKQIETGKAFVDLAHDTGALGVKVRPNGLPAGVPYETTIKNIAGSIRELAEYGEPKHIEIWMEVHGRNTQEPKTAADILFAVNHRNAGACWNSNPTDVKDGSVQESFRLLGPYVRNAHINELYSSYPWREFFHLLRASGYTRYTLAEVPESKEPERFLRYYKALWQQLVA